MKTMNSFLVSASLVSALLLLLPACSSSTHGDPCAGVTCDPGKHCQVEGGLAGICRSDNACSMGDVEVDCPASMTCESVEMANGPENACVPKDDTLSSCNSVPCPPGTGCVPAKIDASSMPACIRNVN
jgi:hypothetical protein